MLWGCNKTMPVIRGEKAGHRALPVYPTLAEVHALLDACENDRDRLLIKLLWYTGGRIQEVTNVRAGDVTLTGVRMLNEKQGTYIPQPDGTKKHLAIRAEKHVFVPQEFLRELHALADGLPATTCLIGRLDGRDPTRPLTRYQAWRIVTGTAARAGILKQRWSDGRVRPMWCHTLRHGHAVNLLMQGAPITLVQRQLGHSSLQHTQVYTQVADTHAENIVNKAKW